MQISFKQLQCRALGLVLTSAERLMSVVIILCASAAVGCVREFAENMASAQPIVGGNELSAEQKTALDTLQAMFPKVEGGWLRQRVTAGFSVDALVDQLLRPELFGVPFIKQRRRRLSSLNASPQTSNSNVQIDRKMDADDSNDVKNRSAVGREEQNMVSHMLANKYRMLHLTHLRTLLLSCDFNYYKTATILDEHFGPDGYEHLGTNGNNSMVITINEEGGRRRSISLSVNKTVRALRAVPERLPEWLWAQDRLLTQRRSQPQLDSPSKNAPAQFDCVICACEKPLGASCSCTAGHMFCGECVADYLKESVYGQAKASLACMENKCNGEFLINHLRRFVEKDVLKKLDERRDEEALVAVGVDKITRCKYCNYAALVEVSPEVDKVFDCKRCMAQICRICGRDWDDKHMGVKCEELNTNDADAKRRQFEEQMSVAVIRECHRCRLPLQKADGCNKLTCSCRATMCYVCRAPNINYNHFCPHPREPGQKCTICTKCSLWEDVEKLDRAKLRQLQADANQKLHKTHKIAVVPVRSPSSVRPPVRRPPVRWPPGPQPRHPRYPPPGFENHAPPPFVPPPHHPMNVQGRAYVGQFGLPPYGQQQMHQGNGLGQMPGYMMPWHQQHNHMQHQMQGQLPINMQYYMQPFMHPPHQ